MAEHRHHAHGQRPVDLGHQRLEHPGRVQPQRLGGLRPVGRAGAVGVAVQPVLDLAACVSSAVAGVPFPATGSTLAGPGIPGRGIGRCARRDERSAGPEPVRPGRRPIGRVGSGRVGSSPRRAAAAVAVPEAATGVARRERSAVPGTEQAAETAGNIPVTSHRRGRRRADPGRNRRRGRAAARPGRRDPRAAGRPLRAGRDAAARPALRRRAADDPQPGRRRGPGAGDLPQGLRRVRHVPGRHQPQGLAVPDPDQHLHQRLPQAAAPAPAGRRPTRSPTGRSRRPASTPRRACRRPRWRRWTGCRTTT